MAWRRSSPAWWGSTAATNSKSGSPTTISHTVAPMRPEAPNTPTLVTEPWSRTCDGGEGHLGECRFLEGADEGDDSLVAEHPLGDALDVVASNSLGALDEFVHAQDLAVHQLAAPDAVHAAAGILESKGQRALEVALGQRQLVVGDAVL